MSSLEKLKILTPLQNLPRNVGDLGKLIAAKGFKKLPKVQKIAKSGHTAQHADESTVLWAFSNFKNSVVRTQFCKKTFFVRSVLMKTVLIQFV